jgi:hypothetical protein
MLTAYRLILLTLICLSLPSPAQIAEPSLKVAALQFAITPTAGGPTASKVGALVREVAGPLTTTVTLLESGTTRVCLITPHMNSPKGVNISPLIRRTAAEALGHREFVMTKLYRSA